MKKILVDYGHIILLGLIVSFGSFLLAFRLSESMMFIGDFGWFYLSSRDMLLTGVVPLVGIPSSHPWLHQGPLWTYLLAGGLMLSDFNPLSGGVIAIIFGVASIFLIYLVGKTMFGVRLGLIAALVYSTSPLIIIHARMPYHTAPIPFFTLLFLLSLSLWLAGKKYFFPVALFSLSMLYNLELATILYFGVLILLLLYGFVKKMNYYLFLKDRRQVLFSVVGLIFPLIPILLYDTQNGFPQTLRFAAWLGYKVLTFFGYPSLHPEITSSTYPEVVGFFLEHLQKLVFLPSFGFGLLLFIISILFLCISIVRLYRAGTLETNYVLLLLFLVVGIGGFFATKTTSEAYLPMLFPQIILCIALLIQAGLANRFFRTFTKLLIVLLVFGNTSILLSNTYLMGAPKGGYGVPYSQRLNVAKRIVKEAGQNPYTIVGQGKGSEFTSFTMNTEYLTWWLGHEPVSNAPVLFTLFESPTDITIQESHSKK